jgi:D-alanyl-D-alanine carboxypeptidase
MSMPRLTRRHALGLGSALIASAGLSGLTTSSSRAVRLEDYAGGLPTAIDFSGTLLLAQQDTVEFQAAYGLANRRTGRPNTLDTRFNLASLSKMFTAICILQLVDEGRISLHAPIGTYLPDYPDPVAAEQVTVEHLLMHTSGIGNYWEGLDALAGDWPDTHSDYLPLFADIPLAHTPGTDFAYSNGGYIVLGLIIEAITGTDYFDHVQTAVLDPAGMPNTAFERMETPNPDRAVGYMRSREHPGEWEDCTPRWERRGSAAGGAFSTVGDLHRFARALTGHRLLSARMTDTLLQGRLETPVGHYGYGVIEQRLNGRRVLGHSGGHYGVAVELMIFPDDGTVFIVLTNGDVDAYWDMEMFAHALIAGPTAETRNYGFTRDLISDTVMHGHEAGLIRFQAAPAGATARTAVIELSAFKYIHRHQDRAGLDLLRLNCAINPDSPETLYALAEGLRVTGRHEDAITRYRAYLDQVPGDAEALAHLAELAPAPE